MSLSSDLSAFGVFDLGANAWEWTADIYDSRYYHQAKDLIFDPTGPSSKNRTGLISMSVRGGSKNGFLTWRDGLKITTRAPYLGFRGALSVEATPIQAPAAGPNPAQPPVGPNRPGGASQPF
jgi:formylglycine-generating enzyme required for sulfatase activity